MLDLEAIGNRIREERKYILRLSQERMAEDLNMYQADISNLEKAKSGSGITDLTKLDLIAEYLHMPLESLIFGRGSGLPSYGKKDRVKHSSKAPTTRQRHWLMRLTDCTEDQVKKAMVHTCGQFAFCTMVERQFLFGSGRAPDGSREHEIDLPKLHSYLFWQDELIGVMVADFTTVMQHVFQFDLARLQKIIFMQVLDVTDVWRTLNPYWALWRFSDDEELQEDSRQKMFQRMNALRASGEDRPVLYIESVYIREDCRQHGLFRMYIDLLKLLFEGAILWLNLEPTSGREMSQLYDYTPSYSISELGQLSINAAVAQKTGFTVDEDLWHLKAKSTDSRGNVIVETVSVHKCAYYLPLEIRELLRDDGDLVQKGRRLQKEKHEREEEEKGHFSLDSSYGRIQGSLYAEIRLVESGEDTLYFTEILNEAGVSRLIVSGSSLLRGEKENILEEYASMDEADESEYVDYLLEAHELMEELQADSELEL